MHFVASEGRYLALTLGIVVIHAALSHEVLVQGCTAIEIVPQLGTGHDLRLGGIQLGCLDAIVEIADLTPSVDAIMAIIH